MKDFAKFIHSVCLWIKHALVNVDNQVDSIMGQRINSQLHGDSLICFFSKRNIRKKVDGGHWENFFEIWNRNDFYIKIFSLCVLKIGKRLFQILVYNNFFLAILLKIHKARFQFLFLLNKTSTHTFQACHQSQAKIYLTISKNFQFHAEKYNLWNFYCLSGKREGFNMLICLL